MRVHRNPRVSIGLPVYNGENFLEKAIESLLVQTFDDFELIISDNASTDRTEAICQAHAAQDHRVRYFRNHENIGASGNFTRVFNLASSQYFKWAAHDDVCQPDYLARCVRVLDEDSSVVLCHSRTANIDENGQWIKIWNAGTDVGSEVAHRRFREALALKETFFVWGVVRADVLRKTRLLGNFPGNDRPLLSGLSLFGRFYEIPEVLFLQREHKAKSIRAYNWRKPRDAIVCYDPKRAGKIIFPRWRLLSEHTLGIGRAPLSWRGRVRCYNEMVRWITRHKQGLLSDVIVATEQVSGLGINWLKRLDPISYDINSVIPLGDTFILVDEETLETEVFGERQTIPFLEKDGIYWGPPPDDDTAIGELERLRRSGANFFVLPWPAFWWRDYYSRFYSHLRAKYCCVLETDRVVVFDLGSLVSPTTTKEDA